MIGEHEVIRVPHSNTLSYRGRDHVSSQGNSTLTSGHITVNTIEAPPTVNNVGNLHIKVRLEMF